MIVASNSITISNVNDGTVVHIAYADSADGKDGFYVGGGGTNLLTGTSNHTVTGTNTQGYLSNETTDDLLTIFKGLEGQTVTLSVDYEYSGFVAGSGRNRLGWETGIHGDGTLWAGPWYYPNNDSGSGRISSTFVVPNNITFVNGSNGYIQFSSGTGTLSNLKLEKGTVAHPWSPAPEEAHPVYMGTYTDYTQAGSTDPTKYNWALFKGPKGDSGDDGLPGKDGIGLKSTAITYQLGSSGTTKPTSTWSSTVPTLVKGQYLWTKTTWNYSDSTSEDGYQVTYIGKDGNNGSDGIAGKDGVGIKSTQIDYVVSTSGTVKPVSGWQSTIPTVNSGQYLWTRTSWFYTDNTSEVGYSVAKAGEKGDKGDTGDRGLQGLQGPQGDQGIAGPKGRDGKTQYTHIAYANSADGVTDFTVSDSNRTYIGMYVDFTSTDSTKPADYSWTLVKGANGANGTPGKAGVDGKTPYFHIAYADSADGKNGFYVGGGTNLLLDTATETGAMWLAKGNNLSGEKLNGCNVETQTGDWKSARYLFDDLKKRNVINTTDDFVFSAMLRVDPTLKDNPANIRFFSTATDKGSTTIGNIKDYADGRWHQISAVFKFLTTPTSTDAYGQSLRFELAGSNGATVDWTQRQLEKGSVATPWSPAPSEAHPIYMGTYTDYTQADSLDPTAYQWSQIKGADGKDGIPGKDGLGIKSTAIAYQLSSSGTTTPTGKWSNAVPALAKGQYLWTRTTLTYTDNSSEPVYSVSYVAKDGNDGSNGVAGKDGVGIKSTTITYATSTSGTSAPTSGWVSTPPSATAGQFIWTRTIWTYTDGTTETGYSVGKIGEKGDKGATGSTGATGAQGVQGPQGPKGDPGSKDVPVITSGTSFPSTRKSGDMHWMTNSSGVVTGYYKFNGSQWVVQKVDAQALNVSSLSALSANLGTVTAGSITGVNITGSTFGNTNSSFSIDQAGNIKGASITGSEINIANIDTSEKTGYGSLSSDGLYFNQDYKNATAGTDLVSSHIFMGWTGQSVTYNYKDGSSEMLGINALFAPSLFATRYNSNGHMTSNISLKPDGIVVNNTNAVTPDQLMQLSNVDELLWLGTMVMSATQTVTPNIPLDQCLHGWMLLWSQGNDSLPADARFIYQPIMKSFVELHSGRGLTFPIAAPDSKTPWANAAAKYVYVSNTTIKGYASNNQGVSNNYTLREVRAF